MLKSKLKSNAVTWRDCNLVRGGIDANIAHIESLLARAGVDPAGIAKGERPLERLGHLRLELHDRGILPIAGRTAAAAPVGTARDDQEAPEELVRQLTEISGYMAQLRAGLTTGAVATAGPNVATLRAEIKLLSGKLDAASIQRKMELLGTVRKIEAGTYDANVPARVTQLHGELAGITGKMDNASTTRKYQICAELRTLRAAA